MVINQKELKALTTFLMVTDNPEFLEDHHILSKLADKLAKSRGYKDWVDAYHRMK